MSLWPRLAALRAAWLGDLQLKKHNLIAILLLQGEVSHPFLSHGNFPSEKSWTANAR